MHSLIGEGGRLDEPALQPGFIRPWFGCRKCTDVSACPHKKQ